MYACANGAACPEGRVCRNDYCFPMDVQPALDACTPVTCQQKGASCGPISNGCGAILDCGKCSGFDVCGGGIDGGAANRCGCTPLTTSEVCQIAGKSCGTVTRFDGCGVMSVFTCGIACSADGGCQGETEAELCGKARYTCGPLGMKDRCGQQRLVDCGGCSSNDTCTIDEELGDGGNASTCGPCQPEDDGTLCNRNGASCGVPANELTDNCGVKRSVDCGSCLAEDGGDACGAKGSSFENVCGCQRPLSGCMVDQQCCSGSACGANGMCCVPPGYPCNDDSECCAGHCTGQPDAGAVCLVLAN